MLAARAIPVLVILLATLTACAALFEAGADRAHDFTTAHSSLKSVTAGGSAGQHRPGTQATMSAVTWCAIRGAPIPARATPTARPQP